MTPFSPITRAECEALDRQDPLGTLHTQFSIPPGLIYLDGNSLGVLPAAAAARVAQVVQQEWGQGLIRSWNSAGWMALSQRVGDKIARLVGAAPGELVVADSTSVNLFKVLSAALHLAGVTRHEPAPGAGGEGAHNPRRDVIVSERSNFPTDLYIAQSLAQQHGARLELLEAEEIPARLAGARGQDVAVLTLTHVNYRTGRMHDMAGLTARAHAAGALTVILHMTPTGQMIRSKVGRMRGNEDAVAQVQTIEPDWLEDHRIGCGCGRLVHDWFPCKKTAARLRRAEPDCQRKAIRRRISILPNST
jgi:kynureninase